MKLTIALALACALVLPATAHGSTTIGPQVPIPDPLSTPSTNFSGPSLIFNTSSPAGTQIAAPAAGIVTRWQFYTNLVEVSSTAQLRTISPGGGNVYTPVSSGAVEQIPALPNSPTLNRHSFSARLPIAPGQILGVNINHPPETAFTVSRPLATGWQYSCFGGGCGSPVPPDGTPGAAAVGPSQFFAMNAEIEPDADADLYGDETQDNCPATANPSQADADGDGRGDACDKETTAVQQVVVPAVVKKPKKKCKKGKKLKRGKCVKKKPAARTG